MVINTYYYITIYGNALIKKHEIFKVITSHRYTRTSIKYKPPLIVFNVIFTMKGGLYIYITLSKI